MDSRIEEILKEKVGDDYEDVPLMSRIEVLLDRLGSGGGGGSGSDSYTKEETNALLKNLLVGNFNNLFYWSYDIAQLGEQFEKDGITIDMRADENGDLMHISGEATDNVNIPIGFVRTRTYGENVPLEIHITNTHISEDSDFAFVLVTYDGTEENIEYDYGDGIYFNDNYEEIVVGMIIKSGASIDLEIRPIAYLKGLVIEDKMKDVTDHYSSYLPQKLLGHIYYGMEIMNDHIYNIIDEIIAPHKINYFKENDKLYVLLSEFMVVDNTNTIECPKNNIILNCSNDLLNILDEEFTCDLYFKLSYSYPDDDYHKMVFTSTLITTNESVYIVSLEFSVPIHISKKNQRCEMTITKKKLV